jgi:hypothetical protein
MPKTAVAALGILILLCQRAVADAPLYVGFLEGPQIREKAVSAQTHVRIAFRKEGTDWKPMPSNFGTLSALAGATHAYPDSVQWTVIFDGRTVGRITSQNPSKLNWYADIGTHVLTTKAAPTIHAGADDFNYGSEIRAKIRPLVLISGAAASATSQWDPQSWKPSLLSSDERRMAIAALRSKVANSERCNAPEQEPIHRVSYPDSAVDVVKSYRDNVGNLLFGVRLKDPKANCDFFDDETFFDYWFVMDRQRGVRYLDSQMTPVDAVDLDQSGRSEWLFFTSRHEDNDGYEIFYDDFGKKAQFNWSYH